MLLFFSDPASVCGVNTFPERRGDFERQRGKRKDRNGCGESGTFKSTILEITQYRRRLRCVFFFLLPDSKLVEDFFFFFSVLADKQQYSAFCRSLSLCGAKVGQSAADVKRPNHRPLRASPALNTLQCSCFHVGRLELPCFFRGKTPDRQRFLSFFLCVQTECKVNFCGGSAGQKCQLTTQTQT